MNELFSNSLEKEIEALNEESAKMEYILNQFNLLDVTTLKKYEKFIRIELELRAEECTPECLKMLFLDTKYMLFKKKAELQKYVADYEELFESIKDKEELTCELQKAESHLKQFKPLTEKEISDLQIYIDKYKKHVLKSEEETSMYEDKIVLSDISKKVDEIQCMQQKIEHIQNEIAIYDGLNPNLFEAREQLKDILKECDKLKLNF